MIQVNELRIGNYVTNSKGDLFKITTGSFYLYHKNKEWDILPIPINKEWLIKLGFENLYDKRTLGLYGIDILCEFKLFKNSRVDYWIGGIHEQNVTIESMKVRYVHHIQNIIHALTGQELTIKL